MSWIGQVLQEQVQEQKTSTVSQKGATVKTSPYIEMLKAQLLADTLSTSLPVVAGAAYHHYSLAVVRYNAWVAAQGKASLQVAL